MKRFVPLAVSALALSIPVASVRASGDFDCNPTWKLGSRSYDRCDNTALLAPGNDTRVNLFLLLRGDRAAPAAGPTYPDSDDASLGLGHNFYSWQMLRHAFYPQEPTEPESTDNSGSRCISLASGTEAFAAALQADRGVSAAERTALTQARGLLAQRCTGGGQGAAAPAWPAGVRSAPGREFLAYLQAADAFYAEQWDAARDGFGRLRGSRDPWLAETAAYMLPRTELNAAQAASFDEYGAFTPEKVDKASLARARAGFADYLNRYARGRYAGSAQGLERRVFWLGGDAAALAHEYERLLGTAPLATPDAANLVEEIDNKLLTGNLGRVADGPLLLATADLAMMREGQDGDATAVVTAEQLAAQAPRFAGRGELFAYVLASHAFYVEKDMPKVLRLIPDEAGRPAYAPLAFSRQVLRGMALAAAHDRNEAGFWRELLGGSVALYQRPLVELALAMNYERSGRLGEVFAPGSPIEETEIREILLQYVAGPGVLRAQAGNARRPSQERGLALYTLLQKELGHGDYSAFLRDYTLVPANAWGKGDTVDPQQRDLVPAGVFRAGTWSDDFACPALSTTAAALARNPREVKARLCLGDFYRLNGFDGVGEEMPSPRRDELGGTPSLFPGKPTPRGAIYADIIADPKVGGEDKAYALFRAINCYAPSGNNSCGGPDVAQGVRRAWFQRLKRDFGSSVWAQKLRYYW